jgi:hypothetical protein
MARRSLSADPCERAPAKLLSGRLEVSRRMTSEKLSSAVFCDLSRRYASSVTVIVRTPIHVQMETQNLSFLSIGDNGKRVSALLHSPFGAQTPLRQAEWGLQSALQPLVQGVGCS